MSTGNEWLIPDSSSSSATLAKQDRHHSFVSQQNMAPLKDWSVHVYLWHSHCPHITHWAITPTCCGCFCTDSPLSNWSFLYLCIISVATMHSIYRDRGEEREISRSLCIFIDRDCNYASRVWISFPEQCQISISTEVGTRRLLTNKVFYANRKGNPIARMYSRCIHSASKG